MDTSTAIREIMTADPVLVKEDSGLDEVRQIFEKNNFHHVLVTDEQGNLTGIISDKDLYQINEQLVAPDTETTQLAHEVSLNLVPARNIMTKDPMVLDPDDSIGLAADIFLANRFHALPIMEGSDLLGILTVHDLLAFCFK